MSGHSKWSQIKHKKGASDQKRGQLFSKLSKAISLAAKSGIDPKTNVKLKTAIDKAKVSNMPNDKIEKAINRATDKAEKALIEVQLEILFQGNIAIIALGITDNKNRTISEIKTLANEYGSRVVSEGSLAWMFNKAGVFEVRKSGFSEEDELELIEMGVDDIEKEENGSFALYSKAENFDQVKKALETLGCEILSSGLDFIAGSEHQVTLKEEQEEMFNRFLAALDDHNDIQNLYSNAKMQKIHENSRD